MGTEKNEKESLGGYLWKFSDLLGRSLGLMKTGTRKEVDALLQPQKTDQKSNAGSIDGITITGVMSLEEKIMLDEALDIAAASEKLLAGQESVTQQFTLKGVPFRVRYTVTGYNTKIYHVSIKSPADTQIDVDCDYDTEDHVMQFHHIDMRPFEEKKLGGTIVRSLFRTTQRVVIDKIDHEDTQKIAWTVGSGDFPDSYIKNNSALASTLGKEFICKFIEQGKEIVAIRVDENLQALLRAAKNWKGKRDKETGRSIYQALQRYSTSDDYQQLDPEAQQMFRVQWESIGEKLSD